MKEIIGNGIGIAFVVCLIYWFSGMHDKTHQKYKAKLNQEFVLNSDTFTIVNYSTFREEFTLSNGLVISIYLIEE